MTDPKPELGTCRRDNAEERERFPRHMKPHKRWDNCRDWQPLASPQEQGGVRIRHSDGIGGECPGCEDCNVSKNDMETQLAEALKNTTQTLRLMLAAVPNYPADARKEVRFEINEATRTLKQYNDLKCGTPSASEGAGNQEELREALTVIAHGLKAEIGQIGNYWDARQFLDKHNKYHGNVDGLQVLLDVAECVLKY